MYYGYTVFNSVFYYFRRLIVRTAPTEEVSAVDFVNVVICCKSMHTAILFLEPWMMSSFYVYYFYFF